MHAACSIVARARLPLRNSQCRVLADGELTNAGPCQQQCTERSSGQILLSLIRDCRSLCGAMRLSGRFRLENDIPDIQTPSDRPNMSTACTYDLSALGTRLLPEIAGRIDTCPPLEPCPRCPSLQPPQRPRRWTAAPCNLADVANLRPLCSASMLP